MVDLQDLLGINEGDSTAIRDITAPIEGDDYISSYYKILAAIETNTIHFADTQDQLPQPGDGTKYDEGFIGVAQTAAEDSTQLSLHYYDFDENEWVDTFDTEIITDIQAAIGEVDVEEDGSLQSQISDLDENIGDVDVDSGDTDLQSQIGNVGDFTANNISSQVSTNETNIGNVGDFTADDLSSQVSTNETDIGNVDDFTAGNVSAQVSTNESDIDSLETDLYNGNGDLSVRSADVEQDLTARNIELDNTEMNWGYVGGQNGGLIGYDASTGFFVDYGSAGRGIEKGLGVLLDTSNLVVGNNISLTGGESRDSRPNLSIDTSTLSSNLSEDIHTDIASLLSAGDKLSWTYDDENDDLEINTTALDEGEVETFLQSGVSYLQLKNNEMRSNYIPELDENKGGILGYDASTGFFVDYGSSGGGIGKGLGVLLDSSNLLTGANLSISGGESDDSRPRLSAPSIGDISKFSAGDLSSQVGTNEDNIGNVWEFSAGDLSSQVGTNEDNIGNVSEFSAGDLSSQVGTNEDNIGNVSEFSAGDLSSQVGTNEDNIGNVGDFTADDLSSQVSTNETDIGNVSEISAGNLSSQVSTNEDDIGDVDDFTAGNLSSQVSTNEDDIGNVSEISAGNLSSQVSTNEDDIGNVSNITAGNLSLQVSTNEGDIGNVREVTAGNLSSQVSTNEDDIGDVDDFTAGNLSSQVSTNEGDIGNVSEISAGNLSSQVSTNEDAIGSWNPDGDQYQSIQETVGYVDKTDDNLATQIGNLDENLQEQVDDLVEEVGEVDVEEDGSLQEQVGDVSNISADDLSSQVSTNEGDIGNVSEISAGNLSSQVSTNEDDIGDVSNITAGNLSSQVSTNEDAIGSWNPDGDQYQSIQETVGYVDKTDDNLATQIGNLDENLQEQVDDLETDIGEVGDTDLQTQVDDLVDEVGEVDVEEDGSLQSQIGDISNITGDDLSSQVKTNEDYISSLETIVENLQGTIPGFFIKEIDVPSTVDPGTDATIEAKIYNSTTEQASQSVSLTGDSDQSSTQTIRAGEESWVKFTWTAPSTGGNYNFAVETDDDSKSFTIRVNDPAAFDVSIDSVTDSPVAGDTISVDATIENTGDVSGTQHITLDANNTQQDSKRVTVSGGGSTTETLNWNTSSSDSGSYTLTVRSDDNTVTRSVSIASPAFFVASIYSLTVSPVAGDTISVGVSIENTGDVSGTQNIALDADNLQQDSKPVTVSGGGSTTETLNWNTSSSDSGPHTLTVRSDDISIDKNINIAERTTNFQFQNVYLRHQGSYLNSGSDSPEPGDTISVEVSIENTGTVSGTQEITLDADGSERDSKRVTVSGGGSTTETLDWNTSSSDSGSYTLTVRIDDNIVTRRVSIASPAFFDVSINSVTDRPVAGDTISVDATIENTGDVSGTQNIILSADEAIQDSKRVTVDGGDDASETLEWNTSNSNSGTFTLEVSSADDSATQDVTIDSPVSFQIQNSSIPSEVAAGESTEYTATIKNTGDVSGTQTIKLVDSDGTEHATVDKTISGDSEEDVTLSATFDTGGTSKDLKITTDDDETALTTVRIELFEVVEWTIPEEPIDLKQSYDYTVKLRNKGSVAGTETIKYGDHQTYQPIAGEEGPFYIFDLWGSKDVRIEPGETEELTFSGQVKRGNHMTGGVRVEFDSSDVDDPDNYKTFDVVDGMVDFQIQNVDLQSDSSLTTTDSAVVEATIKNTGTIDGEQSVAVVKPDPTGGMTKKSTTKSINSGETGTVSLSWVGDSPGTKEYVVRTQRNDNTITDTSGRFSIEWEEYVAEIAASFGVERNSIRVKNPTENKSSTVKATIKNNGDVEEAPGTVTLYVNDRETDTDRITTALAGGSTTDAQFSWTPNSSGSKTLRVTTADDSESSGVSVAAADGGGKDDDGDDGGDK